MKRISKEGIRSWIQTMRSLPRSVGILMLFVFLLGLIVGGVGRAPEDPASGSEILAEGGSAWWSCSMHPQIKLPGPGPCPICFMDLIPVEAGDSGEMPAEMRMSAAAMKLAEIATARVGLGTPVKTLRLSGKMTADETRAGRITAWVPGRLERLFVDHTGQAVREGDPLVELYSPSLYAAQEELLQAAHRAASSESVTARESARITWEAAREKLRQLGLTDDQIGAVEKRGVATDRVTIHSPMTGVVTHKDALEGLYVERGTPIYTIADLSRIWVVLDAYESDLAWLRAGQSVSFTVEALPGSRFTGKVAFVDPVLNERTRTVSVRLDADNPDGRLKPGMFVRAEVRATAPGGQRLLVPASAVLKTGRRAMVYVRKPGTEEPVFEGREIEVGARVDDRYIVLSGLREGEAVVVGGNFKIDSAFQISAKPSMMNPEGGMTMTGHEYHSEAKARAEATAEEIVEIVVGSEFLKKLDPVYNAYFEMQAALADDDFETMQSAAVRLEEAVQSVSEDGLESHDAHVLRGVRDSIHEMTQHAHHWPDIEAARAAFEKISQSMLEMERSFGHVGEKVHHEAFCPMAFGNKGASWLQNHDTVDNPYFGSRMLRCGEIRTSFDPKKQNTDSSARTDSNGIVK